MSLVRASNPSTSGDGTSLSQVTENRLRGLTQLLVDLADGQPSVRRAAVRDLARHPEAAMDLCDRLEVEASPSVRAVLFTTLIQIQSSDVAERLADLLRCDDAALRNAAIEALQEMPDAIHPHLERLLTDVNSDVRIFAVNILAALRHARASEWLADVVRTDTHVNVCAAAVDGLTEVGEPEALPDLEDARVRFAGNPFMEFAIDVAMRRIRGQ